MSRKQATERGREKEERQKGRDKREEEKFLHDLLTDFENKYLRSED